MEMAQEAAVSDTDSRRPAPKTISVSSFQVMPFAERDNG